MDNATTNMDRSNTCVNVAVTTASPSESHTLRSICDSEAGPEVFRDLLADPRVDPMECDPETGLNALEIAIQQVPREEWDREPLYPPSQGIDVLLADHRVDPSQNGYRSIEMAAYNQYHVLMEKLIEHPRTIDKPTAFRKALDALSTLCERNDDITWLDNMYAYVFMNCPLELLDYALGKVRIGDAQRTCFKDGLKQAYNHRWLSEDGCPYQNRVKAYLEEWDRSDEEWRKRWDERMGRAKAAG